MELDLEDAVRVVVPHLAVRLDRPFGVEVVAARTDDELSHAVLQVEVGGGVLRSEALVAVLVRVEHEVDAVRVEDVPERPASGSCCRGRCGAEARVVPDRERAEIRMCREVRREPRLLALLVTVRRSSCEPRVMQELLRTTTCQAPSS